MKQVFVLKINDKKTADPYALCHSIRKYVDRKCAGVYVKKIILEVGFVDCDIITNKVTVRVIVDVDPVAGETIAKPTELHNRTDFDECHQEADDLVHDFLIKIGHKEVAGAFNKVGKWYS